MNNNDTNADGTTTDTTTDGVDIKALLELAKDTDTDTRTTDTIKLYADKLNVAKDSGVVVGTKYSVKVGGDTLIIYADTDGSTKGSKKGSDGVMLSLKKVVKNNTIYKNAVKVGKSGGSCKDYTITHQTTDGVDYMLIDLKEHTTQE